MEDNTGAAQPRWRKEERQRRERVHSRNRMSWHVVGWITAAALALLGYDSIRASMWAGRHGESPAYPRAVAVGCAAALIVLAWWWLLRLRRNRRP